jgi:ligand-binding sensor domain-containing protein
MHSPSPSVLPPVQGSTTDALALLPVRAHPRKLQDLFTAFFAALLMATLGILVWHGSTMAAPAHTPARTLAVSATNLNGTAWEAMTFPAFRRLGTTDGLPHPFVSELVQDGDGFVWALTQPAGLVRFDGMSTRLFAHDPANPGSLPEDHLALIHVDLSGRLWVLTGSGTILRFDALADRFHKVAHLPDPSGSALGMESDARGHLWIRRTDGLYRLNPQTPQLERIRLPLPATHGPLMAGHEAETPLTFCVSRDGSLWVGTPVGLFVRAPHETDFQWVQASKNRQILGLLPLGREGVWVLDTQGFISQAYRWPTQFKDIHQIKPAVPLRSHWLETPSGEFLIGTRGQGLLRLNPKTGEQIFLRPDPNRSNSLPSSYIESMLLDRSGLLWVGTAKGIGVMNLSAQAVLSIVPEPIRKNGLVEENVISSTMAGGRLWLAYESGRVRSLNPLASDERGQARADEWEVQGLDSEATLVSGSADGPLWIGTRTGLYRLDPHTPNLRASRVPGIGTVAVYALAQTSNRLWVGTNGEGVMELGLNGERLRQFRHVPSDAQTLSSNRIEALLHDPAKGLWVGTPDGLHHLDDESGKVRRMATQPGNRHSLPNNYVTSLLLDQLGRLWVGTLGGGIGVLENRWAEQPGFLRLDKHQGLNELRISQMQADGMGHVWVSTTMGLHRIDMAQLRVRAMGVPDGAITRTYTGASTPLPDGQILFGATDGLSIVRPNKVLDRPFHAPVVVTDIRVDSQSRRPLQNVVLTPEHRTLHVEFSALDYTEPERNLYAYRLEGFDRDWVESNASRRMAVYTNLPPGQYQLLLRGSNSRGIWSDPPTRVAVEVQSSWNQTVWFRYIPGILLVLGLGTVLYLGRTALSVVKKKKPMQNGKARNAA